jgi:hypothetical protein
MVVHFQTYERNGILMRRSNGQGISPINKERPQGERA